MFLTLKTTISLQLKLFLWVYLESQIECSQWGLLGKRPTGNHPTWAETPGEWLSWEIHTPPPQNVTWICTNPIAPMYMMVRGWDS